ncbi:unnamed protein product [Brassica oleracea var. botrytis]
MVWSWRSRVVLRLHGFSVAPFVRIIASMYQHWSFSCVGKSQGFQSNFSQIRLY